MGDDVLLLVERLLSCCQSLHFWLKMSWSLYVSTNRFILSCSFWHYWWRSNTGHLFMCSMMGIDVYLVWSSISLCISFHIKQMDSLCSLHLLFPSPAPHPNCLTIPIAWNIASRQLLSCIDHRADLSLILRDNEEDIDLWFATRNGRLCEGLHNDLLTFIEGQLYTEISLREGERPQATRVIFGLSSTKGSGHQNDI